MFLNYLSSDNVIVFPFLNSCFMLDRRHASTTKVISPKSTSRVGISDAKVNVGVHGIEVVCADLLAEILLEAQKFDNFKTWKPGQWKHFCFPPSSPMFESRLRVRFILYAA